ncbi:MAG: intradiol ring-cleavage dioxygenase [Candidatus Eremiobacteraeota bacterium]|nr:intradiol ring-cleavage dioxygenase [Candidatus Eremiobacteraeota bacterium]MCW5868849.1 intradiol ring-cleavage dioxygenase [Candidatus Eremiobacteraeota bacterium]
MDDHDRGLAYDLESLSRRKLLGLLAGVTLVGLSTRLGAGPPAPRRLALPGAIPEETAGPFPADGSNRFNVLGESGLVRSDMRASFGSLHGRAEGEPVTVELQLVDRLEHQPLPGYAVYLWHCDRGGKYSLYEVAEQNYLRAVQVADARGVVRFQTIFPGCYAGRWPHMHFEVFRELAAARWQNALSTSQLALPAEACRSIYAQARYAGSRAHFESLSLDQDVVFADGHDRQLARLEGGRIFLQVPV